MLKILNLFQKISRIDFFKSTIILFIFQLFIALIFWLLTSFTGVKSILWLTPLFIIFIELPILFIYFILCSRRLYSILDAKILSTILNFILFILSLVGFIHIPFLALLVYLMLLLLPERGFNE